MTIAGATFSPSQAGADTTPLLVVGAYLAAVLALVLVGGRGPGSGRASRDFFVAGRSIGPVLLLMSVFGTTMTAFALVGSTGKAYVSGIGTYGLMASISGIVHSSVFFLVGIRLWAIGKKHDFVTQIQFFRARFRSDALGYLLFPILVLLVVPYLLIGILGAGATVRGVTIGMFPEMFEATRGAVPPWLTGFATCVFVLLYVIGGGVRAAALANTVQTIVFMVVGVFAFFLIADSLGGFEKASHNVLERKPELMAREGLIGFPQFASYMLVPLSVGMFPHLFQHWLTAKSASTFKMTVIAHPIFIMIVWFPCVLLGVWAFGAGVKAPGGNANAVLAALVKTQIDNPWVMGMLVAGILAAIMSSLDSQFVCLGSMFTHDVVVHAVGEDRLSESARVWVGRGFIVAIVGLTYLLSLFPPPSIFSLAVWSFSGFASLFPLVLAATHWRRVTKEGALASVIVASLVWLGLFWRGLVAPALAGESANEEFLILGLMPVVFMVAASAITLVVVSLLTAVPDPEYVDRFFDKPRNPAGSGFVPATSDVRTEVS